MEILNQMISESLQLISKYFYPTSVITLEIENDEIKILELKD